MATKQFGRLKLHWSKRGIAYKWGDGEIHRLSFERLGKAKDEAQPTAGYGPDDRYPGGPMDGYDAYGRGYDEGDPYAPQYGDYEPAGYYPDENAPAGRYDVLYQSDWLMWLLLVVLPPLGIWILWKRERLEPRTRMIVMGASAVWFIVLLVWLFSSMFGQSADPTVGVGSFQAPETMVVGATPTPAPGVLTGDLATAPDVTEETPAPGSAVATPRPDSSVGDNTITGSEDDDAEDDQDTTYVWAANSGSYYHKKDNCTNITGVASKVSIDIARNRGLTACPVCYGEQAAGSLYYATKGGKYYHKTSTCSGMKNAQAITLAQAQKAGKAACPVCIGAYFATNGGTYYHTDKNCSGMKNAQRITKAAAQKAGKKPCPKCVKKSSGKTTTTKTYYSTTGGKYYHAKSNCSGMKNATRVTLATAQKRKQTPCPVCLKKEAQASQEAKTTVYATTGGRYYHSKADCSGMKNARKVTLAKAKSAGKTACPVCMKSKASTPTNATYVYATRSGKYYHKSGCKTNDAKNAKKVALATAKKYGKTPCPTCFKSQTIYVYVTPAGLKYHSKVNCDGIHNTMKITLKTALERMYVRCTVCNAPKP